MSQLASLDARLLTPSSVCLAIVFRCQNVTLCVYLSTTYVCVREKECVCLYLRVCMECIASDEECVSFYVRVCMECIASDEVCVSLKLVCVWSASHQMKNVCLFMCVWCASHQMKCVCLCMFVCVWSASHQMKCVCLCMFVCVWSASHQRALAYYVVLR